MKTTILTGDVRTRMRALASDSVHCVVTSPPYWGLRDYGVSGQIGLESNLSEHIAMLVEVFREVRRVMRPDATLWMNYGDAYASAPNGLSASDTKDAGNDDRTFRDKPISTVGGKMKPKDRMLLPARVAIALHDDGWYIRDEIIWHKPNPMPSSVRDRTTSAHEMIYMLTKSPRYYFDSAAIREPMAAASIARLAQDVENQAGSTRANGGVRSDRPMRAMGGKQQQTADAKPDGGRTMGGFNARWDAKERKRGLTPRHEGHINHTTLNDFPRGEGRQKRSVWTVATKGFKEAHFATFPPDLIRPCILAGCPAGGTVLDPFFGAGTTGLVAQELGRNSIGVELNPDYVRIARNRIGNAGIERERSLRHSLAALQARLAVRA